MCGKRFATRCAILRRMSSYNLPQTIGRAEVENDPSMRQVVRAISHRMTEIEMCSTAAYAFLELFEISSGDGWRYEILEIKKTNTCVAGYIDSLLAPLTKLSSISIQCQPITKSIILPLTMRYGPGPFYWTKQATRSYQNWKQQDGVVVWPVLTLYQSRTVFRK